ncbi:uncharacterized protein LOC124172345 isoform X2 [Ischnura elegans]|nr:uncharacterized protein LOC124153738 isoform X2 [Ischnura elegans]XP_046383227.1 uncharacterized protein LOC124153889 isoform X2 [Ischnura elegans]XP_046384529.1 uncharacterized protein LOC124154690 isoform X2 [Ischnura elegans]XP_046385387.1 uncharacterized protein LOC124155529 isoform X2 [Ischnura elegans]XP_046385438.1 uncharacterized protein LOC124155556 isoform X2 [Ischnura elegans]XP_046385739.1 uncharacterized protein LOC124155723 isoform X2 [Ischnura elegans]XP_046385962.1 uncharac
MTPKYQSRLIFTAEQEKCLADYLITCSKLCYGQSTRNTRELAYEMAVVNSIQVPKNWHDDSAAGLDWLRLFLKRNPNLSIRQPENCSLSRCTSFNAHTVKTFFDNLGAALRRSECFGDGSRIWNLDETGTSTVVNKSAKVIAEKGSKGVNNVTAGERGTLVTTCCFVSASGNTIPPAFVFPRVKFSDHMLINAPPGSLGLTSKSGWMTAEIFPEVIKHFIKHTKTSKEDPTLLIMDNHQSHISIQVIDLAKEYGIMIVTLPPHCSAKLQPLDVSCYAPFKTYYAAAVDSWNKSNPGKALSIYHIAGCVNFAHQKAMTPATIINGFKKTGIYPYNRHIFTEADFLSSSVTDQPSPETEECDLLSQELRATASTSSLNNGQGEDKRTFQSPAQFKGYPKAAPRKNSTRKREPGKSMIITDTPEKIRMMEKKNTAIGKKTSEATKSCRSLFNANVAIDNCEGPHQNSDTTSEGGLSNPLEGNEDILEGFGNKVGTVKVGDYVLIEFSSKKKFYYVGRIIKEARKHNGAEVTYLRKSSKVPNSFFFPHIEDIASVSMKDIKLVLPPPSYRKGTARMKRFISFKISFANLDVR